mmetsp:Transcript_16698/g.38209  ORF Transcript_16698/g.38209 Transcript_16698/m.38209 type:complete len:208 (-) Transcript_16698:340-963(-)
MSSCDEPEPPWKTKKRGSLLSLPISSLMYFCVLCRISGRSSTLPGAYTPCTLPKAAAMVKEPPSIAESALYTSYTSSGCVYSREESTSELSTPSSSPPVTPSSISSMQLNLDMRVRYSTQVPMFSSRGSSDRSSMCDEKSGSPCCSKYFSFASIKPSNHGSQLRMQWSVCRMTGTPYSSATVRTCKAPAMVPAMHAASSELSAALPQ